jgi:hypothetical protein
MSTDYCFLLGKATRREANHPPASSVKVNNGGAVPPLPHMPSWRGAYLIKDGENFPSDGREVP